jgi:citrate synthase
MNENSESRDRNFIRSILIPRINSKILCNMDNDLSASEAASILGVSLATLYSYVSRGLLSPTRSGASRSKQYPREAVLRLAARKADGKRGGYPAAAAMNWGVPVLETRISRIADGNLYYRGHDAVALAEKATLESTACILWDDAKCDHFAATRLGAPKAAFDALRALTQGMAPLERAIAALPVLAPVSPAPAGKSETAFDVGPALMRTLAAVLLDTEASVLPLHEQVSRAWNANAAQCELIRAALVLLADHELNASTFTVRCVASTGASLPATLSAGLAALSGPEHGGGSASVKALLDKALVATAPEKTVTGYFSMDGSAPPGFRHRLYPNGDPRAVYLLGRLSNMAAASLDCMRVVAICRQEGERRGHLPNADFALAAMQFVFGWPASAATVLFALARSAGWIAHASEQIAEKTLIRPRARYVGRF